MEFSKKQLNFFNEAANVAAKSDFCKHHLGCIAVLKNKIIAAASNKLKTHPVQKKFDDRYREFNCTSDLKNMHSLHAEIACVNMIKDSNINFKDVELYIVRLRKNYEYGLARPCAACMNLIKSKGIRKIYFSTNTGFAFEEIF